MNINFASKNQFYNVESPEELRDGAEEYVDKVEGFIPTLREVFLLSPSFNKLNVKFGEKGPYYGSQGIIYLQSTMNTNDPENIYGGLFHETTHGFLENYVHRPKGSNYFPESCAIILQVAALDKINKGWADKFASGYGSSEDNHPVLFELVRIFRAKGFDPIRSIYSSMFNSEVPILYEQSFLDDLNKVLRNYYVEVAV